MKYKLQVNHKHSVELWEKCVDSKGNFYHRKCFDMTVDELFDLRNELNRITETLSEWK